jgi:hypothetical protein
LYWTVASGKKDTKQASDFYANYIEAETGALAEYLRDFFQFPEPPAVGPPTT